MTTIAQAIKNFEATATAQNGGTPVVATECEHVKLYAQQPPIAKLDPAINTLVNCERLALSTNSIDRIIPLSGLTKLKILSLGRNAIKKVSTHISSGPAFAQTRARQKKHSYYSSLPRVQGSGRCDSRDYGVRNDDKAAVARRTAY